MLKLLSEQLKLPETYKTVEEHIPKKHEHKAMLDIYVLLDYLYREGEEFWESKIYDLARGEIFLDIINICQPRKKYSLFLSLSSLFWWALYLTRPSFRKVDGMGFALVSWSVVSWMSVVYDFVISDNERLRKTICITTEGSFDRGFEEIEQISVK